MKFFYFSFIIIAIAFSALGIDEIWFKLISGKLKDKIFWTLIILLGLLLTIFYIKKYWFEDEELKKNKFID